MRRRVKGAFKDGKYPSAVSSAFARFLTHQRPNLLLSDHSDYILIKMIAGDKHGDRDEGIDRARPLGARGTGCSNGLPARTLARLGDETGPGRLGRSGGGTSPEDARSPGTMGGGWGEG